MNSINNIFIEGIGELILPYDSSAYTKESLMVKMFNKEYEVEIRFRIFYKEYIKGNKDLIDSHIVNYYKKFMDDLPNKIKMAEKAILEYYNTEIIEEFSYRFDQPIKPLNTIEELADNMKFVEIYFPCYNRDIRIGFLFEDCSWDDENGFAVKFIDGEIVELGPMDIII